MRREKLLSAIERLALGAGMSLAALLLELVLKRRMRPRGVTAGADGDAPSAPDRSDRPRGRRAPWRRRSAGAVDRR